MSHIAGLYLAKKRKIKRGIKLLEGTIVGILSATLFSTMFISFQEAIIASSIAMIVENIENGDIQYVVNTTFGEQSIKDSFSLRRASLNTNIPYYTTIAGSFALLKALRALKDNNMKVTSLQEYGM